MAEDRAVAAGLDGSQETAIEREVVVTDGVNTAIAEMEPARLHPLRDRLAREPALAQLLEREHAPLACGEPGHASVNFVNHWLTNFTLAGHDRIVTRLAARNNARL